MLAATCLFALVPFFTFNTVSGGVSMAPTGPYGIETWGVRFALASAGLIVAASGLGRQPICTMLLASTLIGVIAVFPTPSTGCSRPGARAPHPPRTRRRMRRRARTEPPQHADGPGRVAAGTRPRRKDPMTPIPARRFAATAASALLLAAGCSASEEPAEPATGETGVERYATENPGSVNAYWIETPEGLVLVDGLRTVSDAEAALAEIARSGEAIVAVLVTHAHPDHVGGLDRFAAEYPDAPIFASEAAAAEMATDSKGFYGLTRDQLGDEYPERLPTPDRILEPGATAEAGGTAFATAEFGPGETDSTVVYFEPETGALFTGDLLNNEATPALLEGHTCGWLTDLDELEARFPEAVTAYPGHGEPGDPLELIDRQRDYLNEFRGLITAAIAPDSPEAAVVTAEESTAIATAVEEQHPDHESVASIPNLMELNIAAVAAEMAAEDPATLPEACRTS